VWLDDVQWGTEALWFAQELLASQQLEPVPALVLLTVQSEGLADRPTAGALVESLKDKQDVVTVEVSNLSSGETRDLVAALLGLRHEVADSLVKQSAGNPLFAVQLIEDWVSQGLLHGGEAGIGFREGVSPEVPGSLHAMWQGRVERLLAGRPPMDRSALELAAALGVEVSAAEWAEVCAMVAVRPAEDLVEKLVQTRLARWTEEGWTFVHGMLRETIERMTKTAGRHQERHAQCAQMLQRAAGASRAEATRGLRERIGVHLMRAGSFAEAFEALTDGADERRKAGEYVIMEELVDLAEYTLTAGRVPDDDPRWGRTVLLRAWSLDQRGRTERALAELAKILDRTPTPSWREHELWALWIRASVWRTINSYDRAFVTYLLMYDKAVEVKARWAKARAQLGLGVVSYHRGELDQAEVFFKDSYRLAVRLDDKRCLGECFKGRAEVAFAQNRPDAAAELFEAASAVFEDLGDRARLATALTGVAEVERLRGNLDEAERRYRELLVIFELQGSPNVGITLCNIGLVRLARRDFPGAKMMLEQALVAFRRIGARATEGGACAELLPCAAHDRDWEGWDRYFSRAVKLITEVGVADPDDAWPIQMAADMATEAGEFERAHAAYEFALKLWTQLGRQTEIDQVRAALGVANN
jgi:tetratricopeptide (TPR) repeat protein